MSRILHIAAVSLSIPLVSGALTPPSMAQSMDGPQSTQAAFQGVAPGACVTGAPVTASADNVVVSGAAPGVADITITDLVDEDGALRAATVTLLVPALCNQAHTLGLSSANGGLASESSEAIAPPFRAVAPYQVTVSWNGQQQIFATEDNSLSMPVDAAATGAIGLTIEIPPGGAPLVAGAYSDQLVVNLGVTG